MSYNPPTSPLNYPANNGVPVRIFSYPRAPTSNDHQNFKIRDFWIDSDIDELWFLVTKTGTSATWIKLGTTAGHLGTLTADSGEATPDANDNINVFGTAAQGISTSATGSTLTITAADATENQKGVLQTATNEEAVAATLNDKALVPSNLPSVFASPPPIGGTTPNSAIFTQLDVDNIQINGNTISSTDTNGNIILSPNGTGVVETNHISSASGSSLTLTVGDAAGATSMIVQNSTPASLFNLNSNGWLNLPLQPSFLAILATNNANLSGDGTTVILGDTNVGTALTVIYDSNNDFTAGGSGGAFFTAPVAGRYYFNFGIGFIGVTSNHTVGVSTINSTNSRYRIWETNPGAIFAVGTDTWSTSSSAIVEMDMGDTTNFTFRVDNGTQVVGLRGRATDLDCTWVSCELLG